jgi:hypothetical protein
VLAPAPRSWQASFVATTVALGGSVDDALGALEAGDRAVALAYAAGLRHTDRAVRARALAQALGRIAADVELARLA